MFQAKQINADHKDLVHDVSYDFYGRRFATCSSDQVIKIWDLNENDQWYCSASFKGHCGSVWKVSWAHPEFGQILATCSFDRAVSIWEERADDKELDASIMGQFGEKNRWIKRHNMVDARTSIKDLKFAPKHLGLLMAACTTDGSLMIYECPDVTNLSQWNLQHEISCKMPCTSVSWNPSPFHPGMIAVGYDDPRPGSNIPDKAARVEIFEVLDHNRRWIKSETISFITSAVWDVSFAANVGRDYFLLAVGSKDLRILTIKMSAKGKQNPEYGGIETKDDSFFVREETGTTFVNGEKYDVKQIAQFDDHQSKVWRLSWNLTGSVLASSGEDGKIRLWKSNYLDSWKSIGVINMNHDDQ